MDEPELNRFRRRWLIYMLIYVTLLWAFGLTAGVVAYAFVPIEVMVVVAALLGVASIVHTMLLLPRVREIKRRNQLN